MRRAWCILSLTFALALAANAGTILFAGSGIWSDSAPTTAISTPGASWNFWFELPETINSNVTTEATSFDYRLNGVMIGAFLTSVIFYPTDAGGLFDLYTSAGPVQLFGPQVYEGTASLALLPGTYAASIQSGFASGTGTVTLARTPEPTTWLLLAPALALIALRRRK